MTDLNFQSAVDVIAEWRDELLSGTPPTLFPIGAGELSRIEIGPGVVTLFGGAPGSGKTAFTMQAAFDALRMTPSLRTVVCNVEMSPGALLNRQFSRLTGIDAGTVRHRRLTELHADRIEQGLATLDEVSERLAFVRSPFNLENIAGTVDEFDAGLILIDYIQRVPPPGEFGDKRSAVDATMDYLRQFADEGKAVVVVSAVGRTRDSRGRSSYSSEGLNLASFRESSELEFGADDAFILISDAMPNRVTLRHLKSRHGECRDLSLTFNRSVQQFSSSDFSR